MLLREPRTYNLQSSIQTSVAGTMPFLVSCTPYMSTQTPKKKFKYPLNPSLMLPKLYRYSIQYAQTKQCLHSCAIVPNSTVRTIPYRRSATEPHITTQ
jgi:hypothetical protein